MELEGVNNPYEKYMPGGLEDTNGFQAKFTQYNQYGDVYRHILFVAGTILAGDDAIRNKFIEYDQKQADGGRKESITELEDDHVAETVGDLMDKAWNGKLNKDQLADKLWKELCW